MIFFQINIFFYQNIFFYKSPFFLLEKIRFFLHFALSADWTQTLCNCLVMHVLTLSFSNFCCLNLERLDIFWSHCFNAGKTQGGGCVTMLRAVQCNVSPFSCLEGVFTIHQAFVFYFLDSFMELCLLSSIFRGCCVFSVGARPPGQEGLEAAERGRHTAAGPH